jgi:hypothetical protein
VRFVLERAAENEGAGEAVVFSGFAHLPDEDVAIEVRVELPSGAARATARGYAAGEGTERDKELARVASALVRAATKGTAGSGGPFPRKIVRWRAAGQW